MEEEKKNGDQAAEILTGFIERGDAEVVDGNVVIRGSLEPGQQRPPIPRPPSAQDGRRQTMRLDQVSQKSGG